MDQNIEQSKSLIKTNQIRDINDFSHITWKDNLKPENWKFISAVNIRTVSILTK